MTEVVSRIILIGVTLLLHAEAVWRALRACSLEISRVCQMSNDELLDSDMELLKSACQNTWTSFKAIFDPRLLQVQDPLAAEEEALHPNMMQPTVIEHESFEDSSVFTPDSSYAFDLSEGDSTVHTVTPSHEGEQALSDAGLEELPQFFAGRPATPAPEQLPLGAALPLEPVMPAAQPAPVGDLGVMPVLVEPAPSLDMPAFPEPRPVQAAPYVQRAHLFSPLKLEDIGPVSVEPVASLNMPVFPEPRPVQVAPYVQRAHPFSPLKLESVEPVSVEPVASLNMPAFPEPRPVQVAPYVQRAHPFSPLKLENVGPVSVEPVAELNMPAFPEPRPVQVAPYVQRAHSFSPLKLENVGPVSVEPVAELNMPVFPEPRPVQVAPYVQRAHQFSPLKLEDIGPVSVEPVAPLNMPAFPEPRPVQVAPYVQRVHSFSPLKLENVGPVSVEPVAPLNMPAFPEPRSVQVASYVQRASALPRDIHALRPSPLVPPGVVIAAAALEVHVVPADPVGEPSPPHSPGFSGFVKIDRVSNMAILNFPAVWGTDDPGKGRHEDYFQGPKGAVQGPLAERIRKRTVELREDGEDFLLRCNEDLFVAQFLDQTLSLAEGQLSPGKKISQFDSESLRGSRECTVSSKQLEDFIVGWCCYKRGDLGSEYIAETLTMNIGKETIRASLIGIFDPIGGPKAAEFLRVNFPRALVHHLQSLPYNDKKLTPQGICAGISLTFLQLNALFFQEFPQYAEQGSSATVAFIFRNQLWIANVGTSRAALQDQKRRAFQCTPLCDSAFGLINDPRDAKPKIIAKDLTEIEKGSHLIMGNRLLFEQAGTVGLVDWTYVDRENSPSVKAYTPVHSVYEACKGRPISSISCLIAPMENLWEYDE